MFNHLRAYLGEHELVATKQLLASAFWLVVSISAVPAEAKPTARSAVPQVYDAGGRCHIALSNNDLLIRPFVIPSQGHRIVVHNGSRAPAFIKITSPEGHRELRYVARGGTAESLSLSDGTYRIQYATSGRLAADCETVIAPESVGEFPAQTLIRRETANGFELSVISFTLYTVRHGNVRSRKISVAEFNED